jgi:methyl-accepting chemotaxis protein
MEYSNENQLMNQFEKPEMFAQRIETLKEQLPSILDDFNKYFVLYSTDPSYPEFGTMFNNIKQNLNSLSASLFMVSNDVDANTDEINKTFKKLDVLITKERRQNRELRRKLGIIEEQNNSSKELIDNYNEMYDADYLRNWGLFLSTIVVGVSISKMFTRE